MKRLLFIIACTCAMSPSAYAQYPSTYEKEGSGGQADAEDPDPRAGVSLKARRDADKLIGTFRASNQARVRAQAALALRAFPGDPAVTAALLDALKDPHVMVRTAAARALTDIAPASAFARICEIGLDETDQFALIWIRRAAARAVGGASEILLMVESLESVGGYSPGETSQHLQSGFLKQLLEVGGYSIGASFDFTDNAVSANAAPVGLTFRGSARVQGSETEAGAILDIRAVAPNGFIVWQSTVDVDSVGRGPSTRVPDRFDDGFTVRDDGLDARFMAAFEAGRKAAIIFDDDVRGEAVPEDESSDGGD